MQNRIKVEIVRETPKALLVTAGECEGWIQRRWLAADGTVGADTLAKAITRKNEWAAKKATEDSERDIGRQTRQRDHLVRFTKETENAIGCPVQVEVSGCVVTRILWLPKSQTGRGLEVGTAWCPGWLLVAKHAETEGDSGSTYYERHRFCKGETPRVVCPGLSLAMAI